MPEQKAMSPGGDWTVLELAGEIDFNTAPKVKEAIVAAIAKGRTKLALNLSAVKFLDSTGLAVLVAGAKRAREANGDLALIRPNQQIRRILSITDLIKVLPVHDSVDTLARPQLA